MEEKSQLMDPLKELRIQAAQMERIADPFKDLRVQSVNPFKEFRTHITQATDPLKGFRAQMTQAINPLKGFRAQSVNPLKDLRVQSVNPFKEFRTHITQATDPLKGFRAQMTQAINPLKGFRAQSVNPLKDLRVQSVNPFKEFRTHITQMVDPFKGLRVQLADPLTEFRVQMVQLNKSVINFTRILDEIAKSTTVLIPTRVVDIDAFIESEHSEVVEQLDEIHCPDDPAHSFSKKVFIVCGKDTEAKQTVARWIEKLGLEAIIIDEQPSGALTRIEKLEKYTDDVSFTVALLTPDDVGKPKDVFGEPNFRPSQDVIWELVTLICKHGRDQICLLCKGKLELPSYMDGINPISMDTNDGWMLNLIQEMKAAGLHVDMNKVI